MSIEYSAAYDLHTALQRIALSRKIEHAYSVSAVAPENLSQLNSSATSQMVVYGDFSDHTIYGKKEDNYLFRAWHDMTHLELQADTSSNGEHRVAIAQCQELERLSGTTLANWLYADVYGQVEHYAMYNMFPLEQAKFVHEYLTTGTVVQF